MKRLLAFLALAALSGTAAAQVTPSDRWTTRVTLYGFFPSVHAEGDFNTPDGDITIERTPNDYLTNLQTTFMGAFEVRKHPWSFQGDFIYLNFGNLKSKMLNISGPGGEGIDVNVNTNLSTDLKGGLAQLAVGFAIANTETNTLDAIAGVRYMRLKTTVDWEFSGPVGTYPQRGSVEKTTDYVDGIVGFRGRFLVGTGGTWFVPWYMDAGTGTSRYTYQFMAGAGYRFGWGDVALAYRHLAYRFGDDHGLRDLAFSGPILGATFKF